jgi:hypothetical protein
MMFWTAVFILLQSAASTWELTGHVTSLDGKVPLYTEFHRIELDEKGLNKKIESIYKKQGAEFARMTTTFEKSPFIPEVKFQDSRFGVRQELTWVENSQVRFRTEKPGKPAKEKVLVAPQNSVAVQGFDNFVKVHFDELQKSSMPLHFGVLEEMDFFSFTGAAKKALSPERVRFGIHMSNPLLRLFIDELEVEYDVVTRRLSSYRGLSNLLDDKGRGQKVLIQYVWKKVGHGN